VKKFPGNSRLLFLAEFLEARNLRAHDSDCPHLTKRCSQPLADANRRF